MISLSSANQTFVRRFSFKIYTANLESINQQDEMITKIKSGKNEVGTRSFVRIQYIFQWKVHINKWTNTKY